MRLGDGVDVNPGALRRAPVPSKADTATARSARGSPEIKEPVETARERVRHRSALRDALVEASA